jgi:hypothetical protein
MKNIFAALLVSLLLLLTGCDVEIDGSGPNEGKAPVARKEYPTVNLPVKQRQKNWLGSKGEGSCVHATMTSLFRWQGRFAMANYWRSKYGNGEVADATWHPAGGLKEKFDKEGVRYAYTTAGDVEFLEWACSTRRGCGVTVMGGRHMVALVHFDDEWAAILDNNATDKFIWVPREQFVAEWQNSNGWAVTPVYTPSPPLSNP